jgi:hypothetical protein
MATLSYALAPLTKSADDDVDLTTPEGRERWVVLHMARKKVAREEAETFVDALIARRLNAGKQVAERRKGRKELL